MDCIGIADSVFAVKYIDLLFNIMELSKCLDISVYCFIYLLIYFFDYFIIFIPPFAYATMSFLRYS